MQSLNMEIQNRIVEAVIEATIATSIQYEKALHQAVQEAVQEAVQDAVQEVRLNEREICKQIYIDGADWSEWGINDLLTHFDAGEKFDKERAEKQEV